MDQKPVTTAIFASGSGSNARALLDRFIEHPFIRVGLVISNRSQAGVLTIAKEYNAPSVVVTGKQWQDTEYILGLMKNYNIQMIALAGFLLKIPTFLIQAFPERITNIHPSLLPAYGGKGMYGHFVHEAVYQNKEKVTGMTIHLVNENYDEGRILFQATVPVSPSMNASEIAAAVLVEEHQNYGPVLEDYIASLFY